MAAQDVVRWRAWYVGGQVFDGESFEDWRRLPDDGVLEVLVMFEGERRTSRFMSGNDRYWSTPDGVWAHSDDPHDEIAERYPGASIKRGMWTTDAEMNRVHVEAVAFNEAWLAGEL